MLLIHEKKKQKYQKLLSASGYVSNNGCKWDLNQCLHEPESLLIQAR